MADPTAVKVEPPSFLEMSDEDMRNAPPPVVDATVETPAPAQATPAADAEDDAGEEAVSQSAEGGDADEEAADAAGGTPAAKAADESVVDDELKTKAPKEPSTEKKVDPAPEADKPKEAAAIDYEAEYKRLVAPFKANGRDIQVNSVDDAVALMQMGANYNKKMAALKPNLKLMKMLENNGLLSEDKISFLIDLGKKDPAAINKLVKDSGLDPMDLDAEKAKAYKQTPYAVDDREIELDTVLDEIQDSPAYTRTLDLVSKKWDVASKQTISNNPQLLKVLNNHMASGVYDVISTELERERMLGRLNGMSDIEAYRQVGDALHARGGFNHLVNDQKKSQPAAVEIVKPKPKLADDDALNDKRRAASSTKAAAPTTAPKEFNPLAMSDEEFSKQAAPKFT